MYQLAIYGFMTYRLYNEAHDVLYHIGTVFGYIASATEFIHDWWTNPTNINDRSFVDYILIEDVALIPSAPPMAFEYTEHAEI